MIRSFRLSALQPAGIIPYLGLERGVCTCKGARSFGKSAIDKELLPHHYLHHSDNSQDNSIDSHPPSLAEYRIVLKAPSLFPRVAL
jgi:hypothetical protein